MGDDFEVAVPESRFANFVLKPQSGEILLPQAGEIIPESTDTQELDAPQQSQTTIIGLPPVEDSNLNKVFFGESIVSLRPLLKRYSLWNTIAKGSTSKRVISGRFPMFPYFRGNVPDAVDLTATSAPYNYVNTLLLHWVVCAFSGWRGSIRYKLIPRGFQDRGDRIEVQRSPLNPGDAEYFFLNGNLNQWGSQIEARSNIVQSYEAAGSTVPFARRVLPSSLGTALALNSVNGVLEFELPYYSPYRFSPGKTVAYTGIQVFEAPWDFRVFYPSNEAISDTATYDVYAAAGEDLQFYFFTGMPRMYYESSAPLAA